MNATLSGRARVVNYSSDNGVHPVRRPIMSAPLYIVDAFLRLVSLGPYWGAKLDEDELIGHQAQNYLS